MNQTTTTINIEDLSNQWIVFKRVKKVNFYHRGNNYSQCTKNARSAARYATKDEAVKEQTKLNEGRKAYKFKVEPATKHFVSTWSMRWESWQKKVCIKNELISLKKLSSDAGKITISQTLNDKKPNVLKDIEQQLISITDEHKRIEERYKATIAQAELHKQQSIKQAAEYAAQMLQLKGWIENTDLDETIVHKYQTETDKKAFVLYGRKENVNT